MADQAAEATAETVEEKATEEAKTETTEAKEDKTPETPVTEPITNGSSAPETPKEDAPAPVEAPAAEPERLPLNGLSLEDKPEVPAAELPATVADPEPVPVPEIPVKAEDALPVHDKIADLIPEVPELPTETPLGTASDVAVAN